ncbi:uncharacterized protein LOC131847922 [Achroia grisella]|uniref:uncharacterized protein LOC131847922 n=1 Tax=Achroia grisella TaxID=688607 RepID=UPI0027D26C62|nr:uncharacterized protein LOC131847922 [Achroia grisella]
MTFEIDVNVLINEVRKRKPIYDTFRKEYHDRILKKKLWDEVCQVVYSSDWDSLSAQDKIKYGKEVQKRWASLRHCFRREITAQKNAPSGKSGPKKRKYLYFNSLLFLLPFSERVKPEKYESDETDEEALENIADVSKKKLTAAEPSSSKQKQISSLTNDTEAVTLLKEGSQTVQNLKMYDHEQDGDESFFRSLVPSMRELTEDQKLLLRMEILKLILNFKQSLNNSSSTSDDNDKSNT